MENQQKNIALEDFKKAFHEYISEILAMQIVDLDNFLKGFRKAIRKEVEIIAKEVLRQQQEQKNENE